MFDVKETRFHGWRFVSFSCDQTPLLVTYSREMPFRVHTISGFAPLWSSLSLSLVLQTLFLAPCAVSERALDSPFEFRGENAVFGGWCWCSNRQHARNVQPFGYPHTPHPPYVGSLAVDPLHIFCSTIRAILPTNGTFPHSHFLLSLPATGTCLAHS